MDGTPRKPPAKMESKEPYPIRLTPTLIDQIKDGAARRGLPHTTWARECLIRGMKHAAVEEAMREDTRVTA